MLRILFVDDEQNVLLGIRRATRSMRNEWDMHFVETGHAALDHFDQNEVDVLVTDMRMPGMDGAELLHKVKANYPATTRIILSGHSEQEAIFRSTSSAHQFLAKPCDVGVLKATIDQIRATMATLDSPDLKAIVGGIHQLPALPSIFEELTEATSRSDCTNKLLGQIVSDDVGLTTTILHMVNSAFFALTRQVDSVDHAIGLLGLDVIKAIVAAHGLFADNADSILDLQRLGDHSQLTAAMARRVAGALGGSAADGAEAFLAGMVHDVGLLVFAQMPQISPETLHTLAEHEGLSAERAAAGVDRYAVGAYLLGLWGFEEATTEAIGHLAGPADAPPAGLGWFLRLAHETVSSARLTLDDLDDAADGGTGLLHDIGNELRASGSLRQAMTGHVS